MLVLKKSAIPAFDRGRGTLGWNTAEKASLIALVRSSPPPRKQVLAQLGLAKSTYYDWLRRREDGADAAVRPPRRPKNRLRPAEEQAILALARASETASIS